MKDNKDNKNKRNNSHNISYNKASGQLKSIASDTIKLATGKMTLLDFALTIPVKITKTALHTGSGVGKEIVNQVTHTTRPREYAKSVRDFTKQPTTPAEDFKNNLIGKQHRKDRYAKIIAESRATHQAILEKEQELYESICNPREWWPPKLINAIELEESPRAEPKYELTREVDCVYDKKGNLF